LTSTSSPSGPTAITNDEFLGAYGGLSAATGNN